MKKSIAVIAVIICVLITGCATKTNGAVSYSTVISEDIMNPAVYLGLLKNSNLIYYQIEDNSAIIYEYDFKKEKGEKIGEIENYYLDTGTAAAIDDHLYFYAAIVEDGQIKNRLFDIDLNKKEILQHNEKDNSLAGLTTHAIQNKIITIKNERDDDNIMTYFDVFYIENQTWQKYNVNMYNEKNRIGSALSIMCTTENSVYVIEDIYNDVGDYDSFLLQYDSNMVEIKRILIEGEMKKFIREGKGRITELHIWNDQYIYLKNLSSYGFLGRIKDEGITEIRQEVEFLAANSIYCDDSPLFYQRREDCFYVFDEKEDQLSTIRLKKREHNTVLMAMTAGKKVAVIIWQEGGVLREVVNERENLSEVIL